MSDTTAQDDSAPRKASKLPLILGLVLALVGAGGGFALVWTGLLGGSGADGHAEAADDHGAHDPHEADAAEGSIAFVEVPPVVVAIGAPSSGRHLRFAATLEVPAADAAEVTHLLPRVSDALNSFLQAVTAEDMADRDSLLRLRVQMLHRVRLVIGPDRINDLLVSEFVMN